MIAPTFNDALVAPLANFAGEEAVRKGFYTAPQQEGNYSRWDYDSNDGDVRDTYIVLSVWVVALLLA